MPRNLQEVYQDNFDLAREFSDCPGEERIIEGPIAFLVSGLAALGAAKKAAEFGSKIGARDGAKLGKEMGEKVGEKIGKNLGGFASALTVGSISWALFYHILNSTGKKPSKDELILLMMKRIDRIEEELHNRRNLTPFEQNNLMGEIKKLEEEINRISRLNESIIKGAANLAKKAWKVGQTDVGAAVRKVFPKKPPSSGPSMGSKVVKKLKDETPNLRKFAGDASRSVASGVKKFVSNEVRGAKDVVKSATKSAVRRVTLDPVKNAGSAVGKAVAEDARSIARAGGEAARKAPGKVVGGLKKLGSGAWKTFNAVMNPSSTIADRFVKSSNPKIARVAKHFSSDNASNAAKNWRNPKSLATIASIGAADMVIQDTVGRGVSKFRKPANQNQVQDQEQGQNQGRNDEFRVHPAARPTAGIARGVMAGTRPSQLIPSVAIKTATNQGIGYSQRKLGDPNRKLKKMGEYE